MTSFPDLRLRRLRGTGPMRDLTRETRLSPREFVYPMFVTHGHGVREAIEPMPGCYQMSLDVMSEEVEEVASLGIPAVLLFGLPAEKDPLGSEGYDPEGIVQEAVRVIKKNSPEMLVITDVCMCEYTDHGHCGVIDNGKVDNDQTLELLGRTAVSHVQAGADMPAPSAMMDGQVWAVRRALNAGGYQDTPIMGYAAKYASGFYGPFRVAADSTPQFGDRKSYQMDPANIRMAMREIESDIAEGADIVIVKTGVGVSRRDQGGQGEVRRASGGVQRKRRILDGQGGSSAGLDRREARNHGTTHRHQTSGGGHHPELSRQRHRPVVTGIGVGRR